MQPVLRHSCVDLLDVLLQVKVSGLDPMQQQLKVAKPEITSPALRDDQAAACASEQSQVIIWAPHIAMKLLHVLAG